MKRKLEEDKPTWDADRIKGMTTLIDHLSPNVLVDGRATPWRAVRFVAQVEYIGIVDRRGAWPSIVAKLRGFVSRYCRRIDAIELMFDRDLDATELMFDRDMEGGRMTMEDGTPIEGVFNTYRSGSHLCSYVSLMKTTDVQFPGGLINQVCLGNVKELRRLLEDGVDVNARTWEGDKGTALGMALLHSNDCTETLKCLVSRPDIDAEDTDSDDNTLLHRTIGQVPEARLSAFMCRPVDTHATNKLGRNLLHELMRTHVTGTGGGLKMMALLGQGSGTLLLGVDSSGQLPLDLVSGDSRTLRIFADKGIPIKEATIWELTTVILSFVPVSALTMLILGYYTVL